MAEGSVDSKGQEEIGTSCMRMWMVNPRGMCRKHLLGEHGERHKHRHIFVRGWSIAGRVSPVVQVEPVSMQVRHEELATEMARRGYKHSSPYDMPPLSYLPDSHRLARVDTALSLRDLHGRCEECRLQWKESVDCREGRCRGSRRRK